MKLVIPDDVYDKLRFLCKSIAKVEWSGVLFYTVEGSFRQSEKCKIIAKDILLMDRGTSIGTEFTWDEDIVEYRMNNPKSLDWCMGNVHSHNTMNVFFSGTDWAELNDNSPMHNIYLCLIVNNYMEMEAKIAFIGKHKTFICKDELGKDYDLKLVEHSLKPIMFVINCDIQKKIEKIKVPLDFAKRLGILDAKKEKEKEDKEKKEKEVRTRTYETYNDNKDQNIKNKNSPIKNPMLLGDKDRGKSPFPDYTPKSSRKANGVWDGITRDEEWGNTNESSEFVRDRKIETITEVEEFTAFVVRMGNTVADDTLEEALIDIYNADINTASLAKSIGENYGAYFENFFSENKDKDRNEFFLHTLEGVIDELGEYEKQYIFIEDVVNILRAVGTKFELFANQQKIN